MLLSSMYTVLMLRVTTPLLIAAVSWCLHRVTSAHGKLRRCSECRGLQLCKEVDTPRVVAGHSHSRSRRGASHRNCVLAVRTRGLRSECDNQHTSMSVTSMSVDSQHRTVHEHMCHHSRRTHHAHRHRCHC